MVLFPTLIFAWLYFLLDGVRWVWIVNLAILVLGLVLEVAFAPLDWHDAVSLIGLVLLLLPVTRQYFSTGSTAPVA
jgi:hypothetical protein